MSAAVVKGAERRSAIEQVKTVALSLGLRVADDVLARLGGSENLTIHEYATTGGITLELEEGVLINAPFDEPYCVGSPLALTSAGDGLVLELDGIHVPVERVLPLPGYLTAIDDNGTLVTDTAMSHADRIRVSPIVGCAYDCRFCDLARIRYQPRPVEQILRGIDVALADEALPPRHLLISGGSPARGEQHQEYFEATCVTIARHVSAVRPDDEPPFEVDIMMSARPDGPAFVERMVAEGITGFSLNVEVYSSSSATLQIPLKHRFTREHLEPMIVRAVELLGASGGRVRSLIIPGLEPIEDTVAGIEWLAGLGCSPVISPFRPARDTALVDAAPVSADDLALVLARAREIVRRHGVVLGPRCVPCQHNTLSFPWDVASAQAG